MAVKNLMMKLVFAAVIIIAVLSIHFLRKSIPAAPPPQQIFDQAAKTSANLRSIHIKAKMRTTPNDNFELIDLYQDLVPLEIWKEFDGTPQGKWRIEKPGRIAVMDGQSSLLLINSKYARKADINVDIAGWLKSLPDVDKILDSEFRLAQKKHSKLSLTREHGRNGTNKLVVTADTPAQTDFTDDWCKNHTIIESDNGRIYTFDAKTRLLESLKIYLRGPVKGVLLFEITDIEYNIYIYPDLFIIQLPPDVIWILEPKPLADSNNAPESPKETAQIFFQACADSNWDKVAVLLCQSAVSQEQKDHFGGLEIISIGEPLQSSHYPGWLVPYEIKSKNGTVKKHNLAVRNDNPAKRFIVDGGI